MKMKGRELAASTARELLLITLAHAERINVSCEEIVTRLTKLWECSSIVIAKEVHEEGGFHLHIAVKNKGASKNSAVRSVRDSFKEFEGSQCDVRFHKGWGVLIGYVTKEDKEPFVWGQFTREQIMEVGEAARKKKKVSSKKTLAITNRSFGEM